MCWMLMLIHLRDIEHTVKVRIAMVFYEFSPIESTVILHFPIVIWGSSNIKQCNEDG